MTTCRPLRVAGAEHVVDVHTITFLLQSAQQQVLGQFCYAVTSDDFSC